MVDDNDLYGDEYKSGGQLMEVADTRENWLSCSRVHKGNKAIMSTDDA